ncbi:hypothetical protein [Paraburkholderia acidipaludis]|uniref:hypothetical protein n=1 Tax=Paraburkholderia acidipaludis TaxID=660537 RepID=UPI00047F8D58|nr:hypothetical protein [Paraburkholderia acidipaludis]
MSPLSLLIDHSQLLGRVQTLYSFAPDAEVPAVEQTAVAVEVVEKDDERTAQIKGLVAGTLFFMPFLMAYFLACGSR